MAYPSNDDHGATRRRRLTTKGRNGSLLVADPKSELLFCPVPERLLHEHRLFVRAMLLDPWAEIDRQRAAKVGTRAVKPGRR